MKSFECKEFDFNAVDGRISRRSTIRINTNLGLKNKWDDNDYFMVTLELRSHLILKYKQEYPKTISRYSSS